MTWLGQAIIPQVLVEEVDFEGNPFSYLKRVVFGGVVSRACVPGKNPLECELPRGVTGKGEVTVQLELWGHYGEPDICLTFKVEPGKGKLQMVMWLSCDNRVTCVDMEVDVLLSYDPLAGRWSINRSDAKVQEVTEKMEAAKIWVNCVCWLFITLCIHSAVFIWNWLQCSCRIGISILWHLLYICPHVMWCHRLHTEGKIFENSLREMLILL